MYAVVENVWITPAFHGSKKAHEAVLLLLTHLFERGTRWDSCVCIINAVACVLSLIFHPSQVIGVSRR